MSTAAIPITASLAGDSSCVGMEACKNDRYSMDLGEQYTYVQHVGIPLLGLQGRPEIRYERCKRTIGDLQFLFRLLEALHTPLRYFHLHISEYCDESKN